jgi:hypothetical protein
MNTLRLSTPDRGNAELLLEKLAMLIKTSLETSTIQPGTILTPRRSGGAHKGDMPAQRAKNAGIPEHCSGFAGSMGAPTAKSMPDA